MTAWPEVDVSAFAVAQKEHHQSRASCTSWVTVGGLKRLPGDQYVWFSQNWRWHDWSLARGRGMLAKMVRPSSLITPLHVGDKLILAAWDYCFYFSLGNEMVISLVSNVTYWWSWLVCKIPPGSGHCSDTGIGLLQSSDSGARWVPCECLLGCW